ncbi:MAG: FliM/FliN family flagellar motor switch protein, partial [Bryobacterales bacterium]|nr:FliM/FliN family flagellar motor switch protein [Bryobacterales bacterium]
MKQEQAEARKVIDRIQPLAGVPIDFEVRLDERVMSLREILELERGHVIRLRRSAGENIDILAGGTLIGSGEVVVIEDT